MLLMKGFDSLVGGVASLEPDTIEPHGQKSSYERAEGTRCGQEKLYESV